MWAMLAAPLMIGTDLDKSTPDVADAQSNPEIIAIDQDRSGQQAQRSRAGETEAWERKLADGDVAVALPNKGEPLAEISTTIARSEPSPATGPFEMPRLEPTAPPPTARSARWSHLRRHHPPTGPREPVTAWRGLGPNRCCSAPRHLISRTPLNLPAGHATSHSALCTGFPRAAAG